MVPLALGPSLFRSQHFDELRQQVAFFLPNEHEIIFSSTTSTTDSARRSLKDGASQPYV